MRLLVGTNVFLDLILRRGEGCKDAVEFFIWCRKNKNQTIVTSMTLRDIEYVAMRNLHDRKKVNVIYTKTYLSSSKFLL